jgi:Mycobacterial cell wall arabinan synthesis protein
VRHKKRNQLILALLVSILGITGALASGFVTTAEATSYHWSRGDPAGSGHPDSRTIDSSTGFTPLLLAAHVPESLEVTWSCSLPSAAGQEPYIIVASQRAREGGNGLTVWAHPSGVHEVTIRGQVLTTLAHGPPSPVADCMRTASFARSGVWSVHQDGITVDSGVVEPPVVTGIGTDLDPGALDSFVRLNLTTVAHGPSSSGLRSALRLGSAAFTLAAAALFMVSQRPKQRATLKDVEPLGADRQKMTLDNLLVGATLVAWWLVGPVHFDDGWVLGTVANFGGDGVFTSFYGTFNSPLPLGYLHDLLLTGLTAVSNSLLWLRVPSLLAAGVAWICVRSALAATSSPTLMPSRWGHPEAAAMFLLSWISWNGTLRPEPLVASLVAISMWASLRFIHSRQVNLVLLAAVASALAISIHPAGIVSIAPLVVAAPVVVDKWRQQRLETALHLVAMTLIAGALLVLALGSMGDFDFWAASANSFRVAENHSETWLDEPVRYGRLFSNYHSSSPRGLSVLLPLAASVMFFLRRRRDSDTQGYAHIAAFLVATALMALTPSKWFWHFGTLTPLVALCVGIEASSWSQREPSLEPDAIRLSIPLVMAVLVNAIGWRAGFGWNDLAILELEPANGSFAWILSSLSNPLFLTFILVSCCIGLLLRGRRRGSSDALKLSMTKVGTAVIPATAAVAVCLSVAAFTVDALLVSPNWSLPSQNLAVLTHFNCGLADQIQVMFDGQAVAGSGPEKSQMSLQSLIDLRGGTVLVAPHIRMYFPCIQQPTIRNGVGEIPSVVISTGGLPVGLPDNPYHGLPDVAELTTVAQVMITPNYPLTIDVTLVDLRDRS